ncbi:helix-turn-helix transcriptional regulator [Neobacillus niacini]|uniref:helix-turn-helix domain-containing protein n=1 Tax=Neobacillus niacini TaxID=86668 RepID=UPI0007AC050B|nr:helix-turn-helix transcriptional regulator [Neobacillus niacini]MEC1524362.1 helix-turn-helix transcriptional regulator [Neobacillus niacini]
MKKTINEREAEWINEGARLKKLREDHQMSRAELARLMNTSDTRLARLENGEGVRDAGILSHFYEHIIKHQDLVKELDTLYFEWMLMEEHVINDIKEKSLKENTKTSKVNKIDLDSTKGIQFSKNLKRLNLTV